MNIKSHGLKLYNYQTKIKALSYIILHSTVLPTILKIHLFSKKHASILLKVKHARGFIIYVLSICISKPSDMQTHPRLEKWK